MFHALISLQFKNLSTLSDKLSKALIDLCNVQQEMEKVIQDHKSTWDVDLFCHDLGVSVGHDRSGWRQLTILHYASLSAQ